MSVTPTWRHIVIEEKNGVAPAYLTNFRDREGLVACTNGNCEIVTYRIFMEGRIPFTNWLRSGEKTDAGPALARFRDKTFMAFKRLGDDGRIHIMSARSEDWGAGGTILADRTNYRPALCCYNDKLVVAWTDKATRQVCLKSSFDGETWSGKLAFHSGGKPVVAVDGPAMILMPYSNMLFIAYTDCDDLRIKFFRTNSDDDTSGVWGGGSDGPASNRGPTLRGGRPWDFMQPPENRKATLAWTGTDGVLHTRIHNDVWPAEEPRTIDGPLPGPHGPALGYICDNNQLVASSVIAWTGRNHDQYVNVTFLDRFPT